MGFKMRLAQGFATASMLLAAFSAGAQDLSPNPQLLAGARQGDLAGVTRLLDAGAAVDSRNRIGDTALMIALKNNYTAVARLAVARGADVNLANASKVTPPIGAGVPGRGGPVKLANGAKVPPLMAASFSGSADLARLLLEKGADRAPEDRVGKTAM